MGGRLGSDPALLWPWRRLLATAPIRPLPWEPPYAAGAPQEKAKKKKKRKKKKTVSLAGSVSSSLLFALSAEPKLFTCMNAGHT